MIKFGHKTTYDTGLCVWNHTRFCVMESTRNIIILGKENKDDPVSVHIYSFENEWDKLGRKPVPYSHDDLDILSTTIENNENLLVSCWKYELIWFLDIHSGKLSEALRTKGYHPAVMCKTEEGYIYIENVLEGLTTIVKVKCTPTELVVDESGTIYGTMENINYMHYLSEVKCIAVSNWIDNVVKAIHCNTKEELWEVKGAVTGVLWEPCGLFYHKDDRSLLVCDAKNRRLVALNPHDGSVLQVIPLPISGVPINFSILEGKLILRNNISCSQNINFLTID